MSLPNITPKQQAILILLYRYRFLDRIQIQAFMKHKDYKTINLWLRDLRAKGYIEWLYSTDFVARTQPAIYYLGLNGIRYIKTLGKYELEDVRKRYRDGARSQTYRDRCLLVASCSLAVTEAYSSADVFYGVSAESDYHVSGTYFAFLLDQDLIRPNMCFGWVSNELKDKLLRFQQRYFLEVFDITMPHYRLRKRLGNYLKYLSNNYWEDEPRADIPPHIMLVYPRLADLIAAKRRVRKYMANILDDEMPRMSFSFTTVEKLQTGGLFGDHWEKA